MKPLRLFTAVAFLLVSVSFIHAFTDVTYNNSVIGGNNSFRIFTPLSYNASDLTTRYPVIYFLHGCRGSHLYGDNMFMSYPELGLSTPTVTGRTSPSYSIPYNPQFENYADSAKVLVVACNGNFAGGGCGAWENFTSPPGSINLAAMFKVLIDTVDKRYNTMPGKTGRAITGISLGGYAACFIAGNMPDSFQSASEFCRAPGPYTFNVADNCSTHVDVNNFWRNWRSVPFRTSTNLWDYLQHYTAEMGQIMEGASPVTGYELTNGLCHYAGNLEKQFNFHRQFFKGAPITAGGLSFVSSFPSFSFSGYSVRTGKRDSGYVYLKDVTANGFGVYSRKLLPFGLPFAAFACTVATAANLKPSTAFTVNRYHYRGDSITTASATSDASGKLTLTLSAPMGQEIGIAGDTLAPAILMLLDTVSETRYLPSGKDTVMGIDVVNLSDQAVTPTFTVSTTNTDLFTLSNVTRTVTIPAKTKMRIDSLVGVRAAYVRFPANTGYLKVKQSLSGVTQQREYLIQVRVVENTVAADTTLFQILDGRTANYSFATVTEGTGNANGRVDSGEVFSVWFDPTSVETLGDIWDYRPAVPCIGQNPDFSLVGVKVFNKTSRLHQSVLLRANRTFTLSNPGVLRFEALSQWDEPNNGGIDNKAVQNLTKSYFLVSFPKGAISVEEGALSDAGEALSAQPNPFNPSVVIAVNPARVGVRFGNAAEFAPRSVVIYDVRGNRVADLSGRMAKGRVVWDARNESGTPVPAGIYFVKLKTERFSGVKRLVYLP